MQPTLKQEYLFSQIFDRKQDLINRPFKFETNDLEGRYPEQILNQRASGFLLRRKPKSERAHEESKVSKNNDKMIQQALQAKYYVLEGHYMIEFEDDTDKKEHAKLFIRNSRLKQLYYKDERDMYMWGFILMAKKAKIEFYTTSQEQFDEWMQALKGSIVLLDLKVELKVMDLLGKGMYAKVNVCERLPGRKGEGKRFALKTIAKEKLIPSAGTIQQVNAEIQVLRHLDHPQIIKLYEVYESHKYIHLMLPFLEGGELFERIKSKERYKESDAAKVMFKFLSALDYLASKRVVHRDLKPENLILANKHDDNDLKIADFGFATILTDEQPTCTLRCGSPGYVAPEVLLDEGYGCAADVFSAGAIMYVVLSGKQVFRSHDMKQLLEMNKQCKFTFPENDWAQVSPEARDLCEKMLCKDQFCRITAKQALEHDWFKVEFTENHCLEMKGQWEIQDYNDLGTNPLCTATPIMAGKIKPTAAPETPWLQSQKPEDQHKTPKLKGRIEVYVNPNSKFGGGQKNPIQVNVPFFLRKKGKSGDEDSKEESVNSNDEDSQEKQNFTENKKRVPNQAIQNVLKKKGLLGNSEKKMINKSAFNNNSETPKGLQQFKQMNKSQSNIKKQNRQKLESDEKVDNNFDDQKQPQDNDGKVDDSYEISIALDQSDQQNLSQSQVNQNQSSIDGKEQVDVSDQIIQNQNFQKQAQELQEAQDKCLDDSEQLQQQYVNNADSIIDKQQDSSNFKNGNQKVSQYTLGQALESIENSKNSDQSQISAKFGNALEQKFDKSDQRLNNKCLYKKSSHQSSMSAQQEVQSDKKDQLDLKRLYSQDHAINMHEPNQKDKNIENLDIQFEQEESEQVFNDLAELKRKQKEQLRFSCSRIDAQKQAKRDFSNSLKKSIDQDESENQSKLSSDKDKKSRRKSFRKSNSLDSNSNSQKVKSTEQKKDQEGEVLVVQQQMIEEEKHQEDSNQNQNYSKYKANEQICRLQNEFALNTIDERSIEQSSAYLSVQNNDQICNNSGSQSNVGSSINSSSLNQSQEGFQNYIGPNTQNQNQFNHLKSSSQTVQEKLSQQNVMSIQSSDQRQNNPNQIRDWGADLNSRDPAAPPSNKGPSGSSSQGRGAISSRHPSLNSQNMQLFKPQNESSLDKSNENNQQIFSDPSSNQDRLQQAYDNLRMPLINQANVDSLSNKDVNNQNCQKDISKVFFLQQNQFICSENNLHKLLEGIQDSQNSFKKQKKGGVLNKQDQGKNSCQQDEEIKQIIGQPVQVMMSADSSQQVRQPNFSQNEDQKLMYQQKKPENGSSIKHAIPKPQSPSSPPAQPLEVQLNQNEQQNSAISSNSQIQPSHSGELYDYDASQCEETFVQHQYNEEGGSQPLIMQDDKPVSNAKRCFEAFNPGVQQLDSEQKLVSEERNLPSTGSLQQQQSQDLLGDQSQDDKFKRNCQKEFKDKIGVYPYQGSSGKLDKSQMEISTDESLKMLLKDKYQSREMIMKNFESSFVQTQQKLLENAARLHQHFMNIKD